VEGPLSEKTVRKEKSPGLKSTSKGMSLDERDRQDEKRTKSVRQDGKKNKGVEIRL